MRRLHLTMGVFCSVLLFAASAKAVDKFVTIGTAGITGVYYPTGGAICRFVNRYRKEHGIRCAVESTGGSIENLQSLRQGDLDFGIVQSDWQYHAYKGDGLFADQGAFRDLRAVFSLHSEAFTVLVRNDSNIQRFDDLKGRRVNLGNIGSGMRATMEELMHQKGWTDAVFKETGQLKVADQAAALCHKETDAIIFAGGNPNGAVQEATSLCPARIVNVDGPAVDALVKGSPFYAYAKIPGGMYPNNPKDIKTFGVKATLVTTSGMDDEIVYRVVKSVFDNLDNFKSLHPVFSTLDSASMVSGGNTAPFHPGALKYFREKNLVTPAAVVPAIR